ALEVARWAFDAQAESGARAAGITPDEHCARLGVQDGAAEDREWIRERERVRAGRVERRVLRQAGAVVAAHGRFQRIFRRRRLLDAETRLVALADRIGEELGLRRRRARIARFLRIRSRRSEKQ